MEDQEQEHHLIYAFPRGFGEEVQIAVRKFRGKHYVDLRIWFQAKNEKTFRPTKKGIFFGVNHVEELRKGVERLSKAAVKFQVDEEQETQPVHRSLAV